MFKLKPFSVLFLLFSVILLSPSLASIGDNLAEFNHCVETCKSTLCVDDDQLSYYLRLLFWNCNQECDYQCQRVITLDRVENGQEVVQFHGKWPFIRVLGIQEPLSVLFSILNFVPHLKGFLMLKNDFKSSSVGIQKFYLLFSIIGMNAWIWSSVFHTRDFILTERLDYFSAMLTILYGLYTALVRVFRLDLEENSLKLYGVTFICSLFYVCHVGYLSFITFSYSYNMAAGVVVGLIQNSIWIYFAFSSYSKISDEVANPSSVTWALWPFYIVISVSLGMSFELFDFSPFFYFLDAHSLWHAATIIPTYWWYAWMRRDLNYLRLTKIK